MTGNIGSKKKRVTDEWDANGVQGIAYSDRAADLDHFEWSHGHPRQNTQRVMEDLSRWHSYRVMDSMQILVVF